jgi:hypothetical protein
VLNLYHHRKESAKDRLNPKKNRPLCENRDLNVIKKNHGAFYVK